MLEDLENGVAPKGLLNVRVNTQGAVALGGLHVNADDVMRKLMRPTHGYPMAEALLTREWYESLSAGDKRVVTETLRNLLVDRKELITVLWFLCHVVPIRELAPCIVIVGHVHDLSEAVSLGV